MSNSYLWQANDQQIEKSNLYQYVQYLNSKQIFNKTKKYSDIWKWSVENPTIFWSTFWDFANIIGDKGKEVIANKQLFYERQFFSDSKLNFAKNLLIKNKLDEINGIVLTIKKQDKEPLVELVRSYLRKDKRTKEIVSRREIHFLPMLTEYEKWINSTSYNNRTSTKRSTNTSIKQIREYTSEYQTKNNLLLFPEDLDSDWLYGFCRWSYDRKGLRPSTIRKRMKALTRFSNWSNEKYGTNFSIKKPEGIVISDGRRSNLF